MARINVDTELWNDPRFEQLRESVGNKYEAIGLLVCAWELGQNYWKKAKSLVPEPVFNRLHRGSDLVRCGFASVREEGVYLHGAELRWEFFIKQAEKGRKSAEARKAKFGSAVPINATNEIAKNPNRGSEVVEPKSEPTEPYSSSSSSSSSSSYLNTKILKGEEDEKPPLQIVPPRGVPAKADTLGKAVSSLIGIYIKAWQTRYETKGRPDIGGKARGILMRLLKDHRPEHLSELLQVYCQMTEPKWFEAKRHDLVTFEQNLNTVSLALDKGCNSTDLNWATIFGVNDGTQRIRSAD